MKIGIVLGTNEPEVVWNALRFGITALGSNHEVNIFFMNSGVEVESIDDTKYDVKKQIDSFIENEGQILACGICLRSRGKDGSDVCPISTMKDLLKMVEDSDKILTFG